MSDHDATGTEPTPAAWVRGRLPGQRWFPTAGAYLTSEGQLVRTQLRPPDLPCWMAHPVVPRAKVLHDTLGLVTGLMTTIHADTGDQMLLVRAAQDLRRAKSGLSQGEPSRLACPAARSPQKQGPWACGVILRSAGPS
jgi:hypothetical protein